MVGYIIGDNWVLYVRRKGDIKKIDAIYIAYTVISSDILRYFLGKLSNSISIQFKGNNPCLLAVPTPTTGCLDMGMAKKTTRASTYSYRALTQSRGSNS